MVEGGDASTDQRRVGRGRPRAEGVEERVVAATRRIVSRSGYDAATVEQIASEASVSKGSIYRRWPSKGVLVYDAFFVRPDELADVIDSGDIRADLFAVAMLTAVSFRTKKQNDLFQQVIADAQRDPVLMEMLRTRFFAPRSDAIVRRVELAVDRGELGEGVNPSLVPALVNGSQQYVWSIRGRALTDEEVHDLVDMVLGPHVIDGGSQ